MKNLKRILKMRKVKRFFKAILDFINRKKINEKLFAERYEFYSKFISKGDLVFDVGANIGNRVEIFLALGARVVAIEPQEECCKILRNKFYKKPDDLYKIRVVQKGAGEKFGIKTLSLSNANTLSSFSDEFIKNMGTGRFRKKNWNKKVEIEITTLDELITEYGTPKFIKIDVEGFEHEVLLGLSKEIKCISFEYNTPEMLDNVKLCFERINQIIPSAKFNWSIGETMKFADDWMNSSQMKDLISLNKFIDTGFGDIYCKI